MRAMEPSEKELLEKACKGDRESFRYLVDKYKRRIYYIALRMTGNHSDADDISQETFIKAYSGLRDFRGGSNFYTWLYRILINCCMDCIRKRVRRDRFLEVVREDTAEGAGEAGIPLSSTPADELESEELRRGIREALDSLSPKHRAIVVLHDIEGMTHGEIASVVDCSEGTVRSRLHYARLRMRKKLGRFIEGERE